MQCQKLISGHQRSVQFGLGVSAQRRVCRVSRRAATCVRASASGETAFDGFAKTATSAGKEAGRRFKEVYVVVEDNVKRTAAQVNAKYDVSGKAQQAAEQVSEQAKEVDRRVGIKRRLRNLSDDFQRRLPAWRKQYREFSRTQFGQATFLAGIFILFYTGIAFKILNALFILWWLAPFLFLVFNRLNPQARERQQAAREARTRQQAQFFQNAFFSQGQQQQRQRQRPQQGSSNRRTYDDPKGTVIDVEATTIDEQ